jgi:hypothetical protein
MSTPVPTNSAATSTAANTTQQVKSASTASAPTASAPAVAVTEDVIPTATTLQQAAKLAISQDKRIMLDYYNDSLNEKAFIGEDQESKERVLIKTRKDFTSLVQKIFKVGDDYLIMTENSIYVVSTKIMKRRVNLASLEYDYNDDE